MAKLIDLTGKKFGYFTVISRGPNLPCGERRWNCKCDCGNERLVGGQSLRSGRSRSCGCLRGRTGIGIMHGLSGCPEHNIWSGMKKRCSNVNVSRFYNYGGRGVKVCDRWINGTEEKSGFECFLEDMGKRPSSKHSLDRYPNTNGNYEPGNVRWATPSEQINNRRNTRYVVFMGTRMALADAVRVAGSIVHIETAWIRIRSGWPAEKALTTPRLFLSGNSKHRRLKTSAGK